MKSGPWIAVALAGAASPPLPVDALAGRYSHHFTEGAVGGAEYPVDDIVEAVPVDGSHAFVRVHLNFYNGHECALSGVAEARDDALVYTEPAGLATDGLPRCILALHRSGPRLVWTDAGGTCHKYCGSRGGFGGAGLLWSSKRPIAYLARLKASREYRYALTDWRFGREVNP